ncbi:hypothetical protein B0T17DRAFT_121446 [Bombardia bombarda]|uniref:Uncharacterized protein n=1 Tax=Bombardia bombarda TaxID=252184 RepID=A0AA39WCN8_9PEZI|nr:hypothetical protein B0T17DRAFT_121446 [Bombardia bombarda]
MLPGIWPARPSSQSVTGSLPWCFSDSDLVPDCAIFAAFGRPDDRSLEFNWRLTRSTRYNHHPSHPPTDGHGPSQVDWREAAQVLDDCQFI